jgi:fucokinase
MGSSAAQLARSKYAERVAGSVDTPWWTAVVLTASSNRQAEWYRAEIRQRLEHGKIPSGCRYLAVPDLEEQRIGSGGATIHALKSLAAQMGAPGGGTELAAWWERQRVLILHCGGESRRLPQYSMAGKLFTALPVLTPWGEVSTVFDETLMLSTAWVERLANGLVVGSGDVILAFDAGQLDWSRAGVTGVAIRASVETGSQHGVYIADEQGRVYSFLQKPPAAEVQAAGGMSADGRVAVDTGLLRFDAALAAGLTELAGKDILHRCGPGLPVIDLYNHVTMALTGQWRPAPGSAAGWVELAATLEGASFWCCVLEGEFTHVGTTRSFRRIATEETSFSELYEAQQRLGVVNPPGMRTAGVVIDSVLSGGGELMPGSMAIECHLEVPVRAGRGAILHGLERLSEAVEIPEDTVVHQVPIRASDGREAFVVRVYGVEDDPKATVAGGATWFGRPILEALEALGLLPETVWPGVAEEARTLWNAALFPVEGLPRVWQYARWMMRFPSPIAAVEWLATERLSLASSMQRADSQGVAEGRARRTQARWQETAFSLAESGTDIRPLLAHSPGVTTLAGAGRRLYARAGNLESSSLTEAASRYYQAGLFLAQAGLVNQAGRARAAAFACVERAVEAGIGGDELGATPANWRHRSVTAAAPVRIDLGGGWSDTPPFCLDWGGTVLNIAIRLNGACPIRTSVRRLDEPVIRCVSEETNEQVEYRTEEDLRAPTAPGGAFAIPTIALRMLGVTLSKLGGGLEIRTSVDLPMGSGLGTSSILAATVLRALAGIGGLALSDDSLNEQVMRLEQLMTTGGGWQDQAGGIYPGAKLLLSGPGLRQRLRVEPLRWSPQRQAEFAERLVLFYTGIRRIAKDLLREVVGRYLAREVAAIQVLHSIKTLALEMSYAMREGEWDRLGALMDRHWQLNQILDPHTTNAPINALLEEIRPLLAGAKLAGAGGGGFCILLARDPDAARRLRQHLAARPGRGAPYDARIAEDGWTVTCE